MQLTVHTQSGDNTHMTVPIALAETTIQLALLHQAVVTEASNLRVASGHSKTRGDVRGGGHKPWKQKGTGRARQSSIRSPLWAGGGIAFGPKSDRNFSKLLPTKMRRRALQMAIAAQLKDNLVHVIKELTLDAPKAKAFRQWLATLPNKSGHRILIIVPEVTAELIVASRNFTGIVVAQAASVRITDILEANLIVATEPALTLLWARALGVKREDGES